MALPLHAFLFPVLPLDERDKAFSLSVLCESVGSACSLCTARQCASNRVLFSHFNYTSPVPGCHEYWVCVLSGQFYAGNTVFEDILNEIPLNIWI